MSTGHLFRPGGTQRRKQSLEGVCNQRVDPGGGQTEDQHC